MMKVIENAWWEMSFAKTLAVSENEALVAFFQRYMGRSVLHIGSVCPACLMFQPMVKHIQLSSAQELTFSDLGYRTYDVVVLSHVLEFSDDPRQLCFLLSLLLCSGAHLLVFGFNPFGFLGMLRRMYLWQCRLRRGLSLAYPFYGAFMPVSTAYGMLSSVGFEVLEGQYVGYHLPLIGSMKAVRTALSAAGDRWWPACATAYMIVARLGQRVALGPEVALDGLHLGTCS